MPQVDFEGISLTLKEAALVLGMSKERVAALCSAGFLSALKKANRWYIPSGAIARRLPKGVIIPKDDPRLVSFKAELTKIALWQAHAAPIVDDYDLIVAQKEASRLFSELKTAGCVEAMVLAKGFSEGELFTFFKTLL